VSGAILHFRALCRTLWLKFSTVHAARSMQELAVTKNETATPIWSKPQLVRLGTVKDVAGPSGTGTQASGGGQNRS
jgi:hypothetical protein